MAALLVNASQTCSNHVLHVSAIARNQQPAFLYLYVALLAPLAQMQNVPKLERIFSCKTSREHDDGCLGRSFAVLDSLPGSLKASHQADLARERRVPASAEEYTPKEIGVNARQGLLVMSIRRYNHALG